MRALAVVMLLCLSCSPTLTPISQHRQAVTTTAIPAHLTWVIDRSGSMLTNVSTDLPCPSAIGGCGPGSPCPAGCETRMGLLNQAVASTALDAGVNNLVVFPVGVSSSCGPAGANETTPDLTFDQLVASVGQIQPGGGTPTADTLLFVASFLGPTAAGNDLVLLVTDGVPNCNANNPNNCQMGQCQCTTGQCTMMSGLCSLGCLDDLATLNAANTLFNANIDLMILPIGFDGASSADQLLADSIFGQMKSTIQRACATSADCATGGSCSSNGFCSGSQWKFSNLAQYAPAADRIRQEVTIRGRCYWSLATAETADRIAITLGNSGTALDGDQWELRSPTVVHFKGDACTRLVGDSTLSPAITEL